MKETKSRAAVQHDKKKQKKNRTVCQTIVWHITTSSFFSVDSFADYNGI